MLAGALLLGTVSPVRASVTSSQSFKAPFVRVAPPIDPSVDAPVWQQGILATGFTNVLTKGPATQRTRAWILFDTKNMYVRIECDQPDQKITLDPSAQAFGQADFAGVGIDPSGNGQNVYYFGVTPTGNQYFLNSRTASYFPRWIAKSQAGATSWTTILVIPYDILVLRQTMLQQWRFNIVRHVAATNDDLTWAYDSLMKIPSTDQFTAGVGAGTLGGGSPQAQAAQNALNAQNEAVNPLGLVIWPPTTDAQFWPTVTGSIPATLQPAFNLTGALMLPEGVDRNKYYQLANGGSFVPQGIPYASYYGSYHITPDIEVVAQNNEFPLLPNSAQPNAYIVRPIFISGGIAYQPARSVPTSTIAAPDLVIAPWNIAEMTQAYKVDGTYGPQGRYTFDLTNLVGQGMNDTLFGLRSDLPRQTFSMWFNGALTHHGAGYLGADGRQGTTQTGELGLGGRNPKTGLAYLASYAQESGTFPTQLLPLNQIIDPGLATKTELSVGLEQPFYTVHAAYTNIGPQFSPADGSVNVAGVRGLSLEATANGSGGPNSWLKAYLLRGYGVREVDPSGAVIDTDDEFSAGLLTKNNISLAAGELLTTRAAYAFGSPFFPQVTGYPVNYLGRVFGKLGSSGVLLGYKADSPEFVDVSYVFGPNVLFTFAPPGVGSYINGYQQTYTVLAQKRLLGFTLQAAYGVNHGTYPGVEQTLFPGAQTEGQTLRFASISRQIDPLTGFILGYQSVVGSPTGASSPDTYFSAAFVQNLRRNAGQFSVTYGSIPHAPFFAFARAISNWNFPSYVIGCLPRNGACNENRLTVQYVRNFSFF